MKELIKDSGILDSIKTLNYIEPWLFYKADKRLINSSHWLDLETGEEVKLTQNIKAVYFHKLDQYRGFRKSCQPYRESAQTVANIIGVSVKTVEEVAIPLLKRMGLINIEKISHKHHLTTVHSLDDVRGVLLNKQLNKHYKPIKDKPKRPAITHEQFKTIEKNKKKIEKVRKDLTVEYFMLTLEDMDRLRGGKS